MIRHFDHTLLARDMEDNLPEVGLNAAGAPNAAARVLAEIKDNLRLLIADSEGLGDQGAWDVVNALAHWVNPPKPFTEAEQLLNRVIKDSELVDDPDGYYGYLIGPGIVRELLDYMEERDA